MNDKWIPIEEAAKSLGCDPMDIELLIRIPIAGKFGGEYLISLKQFKAYLLSVKELANQVLETPVKKEKKAPVKKIKMCVDGWISGKKAMETLGCGYADILKLVEEDFLKARRKGKGWLIDPGSLKDLMAKQKDLPGDAAQGNSPSVAKPPPEPFIPESNPDKGAAGTEPSQNDAETDCAGKESSPSNSSDKDPRYVTIKKRKNGCRIDDVANALGNFPTHTIKTWIGQGNVKGKEATEGENIMWYLDPDSLKKFLEAYNIIVTFDETTGSIKLPK